MRMLAVSRCEVIRSTNLNLTLSRVALGATAKQSPATGRPMYPNMVRWFPFQFLSSSNSQLRLQRYGLCCDGVDTLKNEEASLIPQDEQHAERHESSDGDGAPAHA